MAKKILYVSEIENYETSLRVTDKRTGTGYRWIYLGKVNLDKVNEAIKKHPKTNRIFIAGWMFSVDTYNEFLEKGYAKW